MSIHLEERKPFRHAREVGPAHSLRSVIESERGLGALVHVQRVEEGGRSLRNARRDVGCRPRGGRGHLDNSRVSRTEGSSQTYLSPTIVSPPGACEVFEPTHFPPRA